MADDYKGRLDFLSGQPRAGGIGGMVGDLCHTLGCYCGS